MPIKGLSTQRRLPRLGKIRLGIKKTGERSEYPSPTDYFVCPDEVKAVFGEKPRELRVMFLSEDDALWASQWYRAYSASRGLICKGDGEVATALVSLQTGEIASREDKDTELREIACIPEECPKYGTKQCRAVMNLQFLLPEVPGLGVWQIDTSSYNSIRNINSALEALRATLGRVSMVPLLLTLEPLEVAPEGFKKTVHVLNIRTPMTLGELLNESHKRLAPPAPAPVAAELPTPDGEAPDDLFPQSVLEEKVADEKPADASAPAPEPEKRGRGRPRKSEEQSSAADVKTPPVVEDAKALEAELFPPAGNTPPPSRPKTPEGTVPAHEVYKTAPEQPASKPEPRSKVPIKELKRIAIELGYLSKEEIYQELGITSMSDWYAAGKTNEEAIEKLREKTLPQRMDSTQEAEDLDF